MWISSCSLGITSSCPKTVLAAENVNMVGCCAWVLGGQQEVVESLHQELRLGAARGRGSFHKELRLLVLGTNS